MENHPDNHSAYLSEQEHIRQLSESDPGLFALDVELPYEEILARIGIKLPEGNLPLGIIKLHALDFMVEEILADGTAVSVYYQKPETPGGPKPFLEATLVKCGLSTFDAVKELSGRLGISETKIAYAGVKDAKALTSQKISLSGVNPAALAGLQAGNYFLKDIAFADGPISQSRIAGNRFTILVRAEDGIDKQSVIKRMAALSEHGFWNYYWTQRFGTRLLSHRWGLMVLKNKPDQLVKSYLTESGPHDAPYFRQIREQAKSAYGDWDQITELYRPFPFTMRYELLILDHLRQYQSDFVGALRSIPEQVRFWTYAYASYLANRLITSYATGSGEAPSKIPLILTPNMKERELYRQFLEEDGLPMDFRTGRFDFIRFVSRTLETKVVPTIRNSGSLPEGLVFEFDLPKGAYATTFLSHAFTLAVRKDYPWLKEAVHDLKQALGEPPLTETIAKLNILDADSGEQSTPEE